MLHNVINSMINTTIQPFIHLLSYASPWKLKIYVASIYSIINKLFDIAPEILIGIAVDLVVQTVAWFPPSEWDQYFVHRSRQEIPTRPATKVKFERIVI